MCILLWSCHSTQWVCEDNNARNGSREKEQRKAKPTMGEIHHIYIWCDGSSKQSGGGQASISQTSRQRRPEEDMLREEES